MANQSLTEKMQLQIIRIHNSEPDRYDAMQLGDILKRINAYGAHLLYYPNISGKTGKYLVSELPSFQFDRMPNGDIDTDMLPGKTVFENYADCLAFCNENNKKLKNETMIRELKKEAKIFLSESGYGKGTNFTTAQVSGLMARFAVDAVNKNGLSSDISGSYCDYLSLTLDGVKPEEAARECGLL